MTPQQAWPASDTMPPSGAFNRRRRTTTRGERPQDRRLARRGDRPRDTLRGWPGTRTAKRSASSSRDKFNGQAFTFFGQNSTEVVTHPRQPRNQVHRHNNPRGFMARQTYTISRHELSTMPRGSCRPPSTPATQQCIKADRQQDKADRERSGNVPAGYPRVPDNECPERVSSSVRG